MVSPDTVHVFAADSADPIPLAVTVRRIACGARAFDVPVYRTAQRDVGDEVLARYQGSEHVAVVAKLCARTQLHVIEAPLPHMFMTFAAGADRVAEVLASPP